MTRIVGVEHESKWALDHASADADPLRWLDSPPVRANLTGLTETVVATQGTVYLDDAERRLTSAGHSLRIAANQGRLAGIGWIGVKQTVDWTGRRDALEISERIDPGELTAVLTAGEVLPLRHLRSLGLVRGPLETAGVTSQRRIKRFGKLDGGHPCVFSVDLVEFRGPDGDITPIGEYACLEIEVNQSSLECLEALDAFCADVDAWLGSPRESRTKAQLAVAAADAARLVR
ncbi:hypothetical protein GCM10027598_01700 [Amycolatopsis oliviviridis]|uniref:CYTH domain-containing protein n=1 Tax=Amycolatopsis oliviviridis TaxID=1471590 RepID=A0ABQ3LT05_9PSEU|nr:hypothetical protein [Amycolatopsis oliviviridis]GHH22436.1 hypothetical protein GCM10017790_44180 [Amycolatopsis oliviviridis]